VWRWLRDRRFGNWKFRRQYPVGRFIADFYCDPLKLVIEIDGLAHAYRFARDSARTRYLGKIGIQVVRIANQQVLQEPVSDAEAIVAAILVRLPHTRRSAAPSPRERVDKRLPAE
jgi:very-short-patch-repair endonuclease